MLKQGADTPILTSATVVKRSRAILDALHGQRLRQLRAS